MTIFLQNKVQNPDIYPNPEHRNASLENMAEVYWAPWYNFWTSSFQNTWYCVKPWVRKEGFRWRDDFISSSIPFKMKATCSSSVWAQIWQMTSKSPLPKSVSLWNPQNCGNEKNSPLVQVPKNSSRKDIKFAFSVRDKVMSVLTDMALFPCKCAVLSSGLPPKALQTSRLSYTEVWVWIERTLQPLDSAAFSPIFTSLSAFSKGQSLSWTLAYKISITTEIALN